MFIYQIESAALPLRHTPISILKFTNENRTPLVLTLGYDKELQNGSAFLRSNEFQYRNHIETH